MRRVDWVERLAQTLEGRRHFPFVWGGRDGAHDCCTFAAACVDAITGRRCVDELLEHYQDEASAKAYIAASGGLSAAISSHLGKSKPAELLRDGDIAIVKVGRKEFVGVVVGDDLYSASPNGLVSVPLHNAVIGWAV